MGKTIRNKTGPYYALGFKVPHSHQQSQVILRDDRHIMLSNHAILMSM
jgi:hypothetical protein